MPKGYTGSDLVYPLHVPVPRDGEPVSEPTWVPSWKKLADRAACLKRMIPTPVSHTYANDGVAAWTYGNSGAIETTIAAGHYVDVPNCRVGDIVQLEFFGVWERTGTHNSVGWNAWIDVIDNATGTSPATQTHVAGTHWDESSGILSSDLGILFPLSMGGTWTVATAGTSRFAFALQQSASWSTDTFVLTSSLSFVAVLFAQYTPSD